MNREFNYTIKDPEDFQKKFQEFATEMTNLFKAKDYKSTYNLLLEQADCYKSISIPFSESDQCVNRCTEKMAMKVNTMNNIWNSGLSNLGSCMQACGDKDTICYSACFNDAARKIHSELTSFYDNLV